MNMPQALQRFALPFVIVLMAASGQAQTRVGVQSLEDARERLNYEPTVSETMKKVLAYFRVDPESFDELRENARSRALLPTLAAGYIYQNEGFGAFERREIFEPYTLDVDRGLDLHEITIGGVWDLRELIFNPAEVQVYGIIGVQRNLMLETTRIYYLRRQLFVRFLESPPEDPLAREALLLRIDEFTALLDVLSGGWFTKTTNQRVKRASLRRGKRRTRR